MGVVSEYADVLDNVFRAVVPALGHMGIEVVEAEPGRVVLRLPFRAENGNHIGTVYAGVLYSFLEASGGALILTSLDVSRWVPVIVESTVRFRRPALGAITATLTLTDQERDALASGLAADPKMRWTYTARATDDEGALVCEADLVYRFRAVA